MNIAFTYNVRHVKPELNNPQYISEAEFDEPSTIQGIEDGLRQLGHQVFRVEANESAYLKFKNLKNKVDLVFNIAEGMHGRDREAQIPAMLEMLEIPYIGPSPLGYALGLNKVKAKEVMVANNILTPRWLVIEKVSDLENLECKFFPVILKPAGEGSSKGIHPDNLVYNIIDLRRVAKKLLREFKQKVLLEEFLPGREFTVAILGYPPRVLPIIEVVFDKLPKGMPKFDHAEAKWIYDNPAEKADPLVCPAKINASLRKQIEDVALCAFGAVEMTDWARIDIRLDKDNAPSVIEINCPPGIIPDPKENSRFPRAARAAGLNYKTMLKTIINSACRRYGIKYN